MDYEKTRQALAKIDIELVDMLEFGTDEYWLITPDTTIQADTVEDCTQQYIADTEELISELQKQINTLKEMVQ